MGFFDLVENRNNPKTQEKPYAQDVNFNLITEKWQRIKSMALAWNDLLHDLFIMFHTFNQENKLQGVVSKNRANTV